jgi:hypothetical protein
MHAVQLVTAYRNRVRAQCCCAWRSPWITPDAQSQPRQKVAERVAIHHLHYADLPQTASVRPTEKLEEGAVASWTVPGVVGRSVEPGT